MASVHGAADVLEGPQMPIPAPKDKAFLIGNGLVDLAPDAASVRLRIGTVEVFRHRPPV